ncbi:putative hotdog family 3-hydroxylacyl-ACP dehydratase [Oxalobacteraceae bacterium GrIS 2.11]
MIKAFPEIADLIPHRSSMVLLDRVIATSADSLCAEVRIRSGDIFFDADIDGVGAWVGIEYMAQAIAAHEGYQALARGDAVKIGFLLGARRYESHCAKFALGSVLQVYVHHVLEHENGLGAFECRITDVAATLLANATVTVFKPDNVGQFLERSNG